MDNDSSCDEPSNVFVELKFIYRKYRTLGVVAVTRRDMNLVARSGSVKRNIRLHNWVCIV